jgi:hypothetical protein
LAYRTDACRFLLLQPHWVSVPGGFFLVGNFGDYNPKVFYLKLSYNW